VRLAIADPPYPPLVGSGGRKNRASRWYGDGQRSHTDRPADHHPDAARWDDPAAHRLLFLELCQDYDGFALATTPDGLEVYRPFPVDIRVMAWVKPNAQPGAHRLRSCWEPVIIRVPEGRRSNRGGRGAMPDVLTASVGRGFIGRKPEEWTHWVLAAMSYDPAEDTVHDLFVGSGAVTAAIGTTRTGSGRLPRAGAG
jgi:hypothetical protein